MAERAMETFFRLYRLLQLLPRTPQGVDTSTLVRRLRNEGFEGARRTLQRDLVRLESMGFGIQCVSDTKPYRWSLLQQDVLELPLPRAGRRRASALQIQVFEPTHALLTRHQNVHLAPRSQGSKNSDVATLHVEDGPQLRWWLLALAGAVEVVAPAGLRDAIVEAHRAALDRYGARASHSVAGNR